VVVSRWLGGGKAKAQGREMGRNDSNKLDRDGLRLKSDNLMRCCRLQDRGQCRDRVRADGVTSLIIVAAGERRGSLSGVGFENMMRSWVMK